MQFMRCPVCGKDPSRHVFCTEPPEPPVPGLTHDEINAIGRKWAGDPYPPLTANVYGSGGAVFTEEMAMRWWRAGERPWKPPLPEPIPGWLFDWFRKAGAM
jgi:hypothetical protein